MRKSTLTRTVIAIAAVTLAANGAICAERMVVNEHFSALG